jgi:hypothetical protein
MQNFYFYIFYFFIFILGWALPARPGHWLGPVTRWGPNQQEARVECHQILHACMYCAKVINLPSRSAIFLTKWGKEEKTKTDLPVRREAETRWRISGRSLLPPILFPSPSVSDPLISCSFSLFCIFFRLCWKWLRQWPTFSFFLLSFWGWKLVFVPLLPFFGHQSPLSQSFCFFFFLRLCFFSPLVRFFVPLVSPLFSSFFYRSLLCLL